MLLIMEKKNAIQYYQEVLKKYAVFTGRAGRREYWYFALVNFVVSVLLGLIFSIFSDTLGDIIGLVYGLAVLVPSLAVSVRRLHDSGKSGWMLLVGLIPIVGVVWLIVLHVRKGNEGINKYGPVVEKKETKTKETVDVEKEVVDAEVE
jgi:uncharacterized membrane protein YhaH (DUF805 family)